MFTHTGSLSRKGCLFLTLLPVQSQINLLERDSMLSYTVSGDELHALVRVIRRYLSSLLVWYLLDVMPMNVPFNYHCPITASVSMSVCDPHCRSRGTGGGGGGGENAIGVGLSAGGAGCVVVKKL